MKVRRFGVGVKRVLLHLSTPHTETFLRRHESVQSSLKSWRESNRVRRLKNKPQHFSDRIRLVRNGVNFDLFMRRFIIALIAKSDFVVSCREFSTFVQAKVIRCGVCSLRQTTMYVYNYTHSPFFRWAESLRRLMVSGGGSDWGQSREATRVQSNNDFCTIQSMILNHRSR